MNLNYICRFANYFYKTANKLDFPMAGKIVSGLKVREEVPNINSISSSFNNYHILSGVREVSLDHFPSYTPNYYSAQEEKKTKDLAKEIQTNQEINPLIVAVDSKGPYILEGGHRFDALIELGIKSFPALVIIEES